MGDLVSQLYYQFKVKRTHLIDIIRRNINLS